MSTFNSVRKWGCHDEQLLLRKFQAGEPISAIAKQLDRTEGAISIRLKKISVRLRNDGEPPEIILERTGVTKDQVDEQIKIESRQNGHSDRKLSGHSDRIKQKLLEIIEML